MRTPKQGLQATTKEEKKPMIPLAMILATVVHGGFVPLLWVIGIVLIVAGIVSLVRGGLLVGAVLIIVGILLGGLNIF